MWELEVKRNVGLSEDDTHQDTKIREIVDRARIYFRSLVGTDDIEDLDKELFLAYCRFAYNNATEYFEESYDSEITRLQFLYAVKEGVTDEE